MRAAARVKRALLIFAAAVTMSPACSSPGDRCLSEDDCGGNLVCVKFEVDGGQSPSGICTHPGAGLNGYCRVADDCVAALFCSNELPSPSQRRDGVCIPLRIEGESCADSGNCQSPLECAPTDAGSGTCRPRAPAPDAGVEIDATVDPDAAAAA